MLVIDGIKYKLWTPMDEEKEFHPMVKKYSKEIFGEDSHYFDVKHKLKSKSGIVSIPDAYVITLSKPYEWYIVENELSTHPVYSHIVPQILKFISGIENLRSQREIRDILYDEINHDKILKEYVETKIGSEVYRFLSKLLSKRAKIVIVIDEITEQIKDVCKFLEKFGIQIVEFKTFVREDEENVHAHQFKPLYIPREKSRVSEGKPKRERRGRPTDEQILTAMEQLQAEGKTITSTVLRDHFQTKNRGVIRQAMRGLAKAGKIRIEELGGEGKKKHFVYKLP